MRVSARELRRLGRLGAMVFSAATVVPCAARAQDSTWSSAPGSNLYSTASNWSAGVPSGTAIFDATGTPNITVDGGQTVGAFQFTSNASTYNFTMTGGLTFNGTGIQNNSSNDRHQRSDTEFQRQRRHQQQYDHQRQRLLHDLH